MATLTYTKIFNHSVADVHHMLMQGERFKDFDQQNLIRNVTVMRKDGQDDRFQMQFEIGLKLPKGDLPVPRLLLAPLAPVFEAAVFINVNQRSVSPTRIEATLNSSHIQVPILGRKPILERLNGVIDLKELPNGQTELKLRADYRAVSGLPGAVTDFFIRQKFEPAMIFAMTKIRSELGASLPIVQPA